MKLMPWFYIAAATATQVGVVYANHGAAHGHAARKSSGTTVSQVAVNQQKNALGVNLAVEDYRSGHYFKALQQFAQQSKYNPVEAYYLAKMNLYGYGQLKNNDKAFQLYAQAGEGGFLPAQAVMARYLLLEKNDPVGALYWFKKSADANDLQAQLYVAAAYLFGYGVPKNPDKARQYYIGAAKQGNSIAQLTIASYFLDSKHAENKKLGMIWLEKAVAQHDPNAQLLMAKLLIEGKLLPKSLEKANEWVDLAISEGSTEAMIQKGDMAFAQHDANAAKTWYEKAAEKGDLHGDLALGQLYLDKKSSLYEPHKGFLSILKAAQNELPEAQQALSDMYSSGVGVDVNAVLAKEWQIKAAHNDALSPAVAAAKWLSNGKSTHIADSGYQLKGILADWDNIEAQQQNNYNPSPHMVKLTREMVYKPHFELTTPDTIPINEYYDALAKSLRVQAEAPIMFLHYPMNDTLTSLQDALAANKGEVDEKTKAIIDRIQLDASLGNGVAQYELGQIYQYGLGVKPDVAEAIKNYEFAAGQDDPLSMYALGLLYMEGQASLAPDYTKGMAWLNQSAFKGNAYAQFVLAQIYDEGLKNKEGVLEIKPNPGQAEGMYFLAAANHSGEAQYRLAERLVRQKQDDLTLTEKHTRQAMIKSLYQGAIANGVTKAALPLAFFDAMDSDKAKQAQAFSVAQKEADNGQANGALLLGLLYDRGIGVTASKRDAVYWYKKAGDNLVSQFVLGTYYSLGTELSQDKEKGQQLLQQSADAQFAYADLNLAVMHQQENKAFLPLLDKALSLGNAKAGLLLADYYLSEASTDTQLQQARDIYQRFAEKGDENAQLKLAFMYEKGLGGQADAQHALAWYQLSANQGQPLAQYLLGRLYQFGYMDVMPDYELAKHWYSLAQSNYSPAAVALGFVYDTVDDNYAQAKTSYQLAADAHDAVAAYNLGLIYEEGKGQPVDYDKAQLMYQQAADQGSTQAMVRLAGLYFNGKSNKGDPMEALSIYQKAASKGDRDAYYRLGLLTEAGVTTKTDYTQALQYYEASAKLGNQKGMLAAARMYQYGMGVQPDKSRSEQYYQMLADMGNPFAQRQLALLNGRSVSPDVGKQITATQANKADDSVKHHSPQLLVSFVEPLSFRYAQFLSSRPVELLYLDALNQWNCGDNEQSKMTFERIRSQYPDFIPARRITEWMNLG